MSEQCKHGGEQSAIHAFCDAIVLRCVSWCASDLATARLQPALSIVVLFAAIGVKATCDGRPIALAYYCALEAKAEDEYSMRKSKERTMKECMKKRRGNELPRTAPDNCRGQAKRRLLRVELQSDAMQYVNNNVLQ